MTKRIVCLTFKLQQLFSFAGQGDHYDHPVSFLCDFIPHWFMVKYGHEAVYIEKG
ncbi:hypothetical protein [Metabacillus idriensis]|uniref:hypothetical protein n=1 Tax=Metabacillus idriensis TaxID=324768 RepID=UPI00174E5C14|nr:hypothetical protein [Metabacillus idriensis]